MPDEKLPLILHTGSGLALTGPQGGRIVAEMVGGALALSRIAEGISAALVPRFRIGEFLFCEPDYQQILLWAKDLNLEPETVIARLLTGETRFLDGRIIALVWDLELLPIESFHWVSGLLIGSLEFSRLQNFRGIRLTIPLSELRCLRCSQIGFLSLDLSAVPKLNKLSCSFNRLTELNLSAVPQLAELWCDSNQLTSIDLTSVPELTKLGCSSNQLTNLDLCKVPRLRYLECYDNHLLGLDLTSVPLLTELWCCGSQLIALDLSAVPLLTDLTCTDNLLTSLDLSAVPHLKILKIRGNQLTRLDVSAVPLLTELWCDFNDIKELDIRPLEQLETLLFDADKTRLIQRPDQHF